MSKYVDFIDDINNKYSTYECDLEQRLRDLQLAEQQLDKTNEVKRVTFDKQQKQQKSTQLAECKNASEARRRNANLIKELEISKARLRSRSTYTPLEQELSKAIYGYNQQRSLVPIRRQHSVTRKVYGPTFV